MLIIFDLDDTLVDTSYSLTPLRLEAALKRMIKEGLCVDSFDTALKQLLDMNVKAPSSKEALTQFSLLYPKGEHYLSHGLEVFKEPLPPDSSLKAMEGAQELLNELMQEHKLALVTMGEEAIQLEKMKKAGIEAQIFSTLIVCGGPSKKPYYRQVLLALNETDGLVCGDRVALDLTPAKELGLQTVHMRKGRGLYQTQPAQDVDFSIHKLEELKGIITTYVSKNAH